MVKERQTSAGTLDWGRQVSVRSGVGWGKEEPGGRRRPELPDADPGDPPPSISSPRDPGEGRARRGTRDPPWPAGARPHRARLDDGGSRALPLRRPNRSRSRNLLLGDTPRFGPSPQAGVTERACAAGVGGGIPWANFHAPGLHRAEPNWRPDQSACGGGVTARIGGGSNPGLDGSARGRSASEQPAWNPALGGALPASEGGFDSNPGRIPGFDACLRRRKSELLFKGLDRACHLPERAQGVMLSETAGSAQPNILDAASSPQVPPSPTSPSLALRSSPSSLAHRSLLPGPLVPPPPTSPYSLVHGSLPRPQVQPHPQPTGAGRLLFSDYLVRWGPRLQRGAVFLDARREAA